MGSLGFTSGQFIPWIHGLTSREASPPGGVFVTDVLPKSCDITILATTLY